MNFENEDRLQFQELAGGSIIEYPPLYANTGEHILFLVDKGITVYSTTTGQLVRKMEGAKSQLVDYGFELDNDDHIVACSQSGEILTWSWKTGELKSNVQMKVDEGVVTNFKLLNLWGNSKLSYAFMCMTITRPKKSTMTWRVVDRTDGKFIPVPFDLSLTATKTLMAVDDKNFPNLVLVQGFHVYFINYKKWTWRKFMNANRVPVTVLQKHPSEDCFATGDETGKIFLWREFTSPNDVKTTLYHWHHTKVTSIFFTVSGANFFSSGEEAVLVKWNVENPKLRKFLPRMSSIIKHIVVSPDNSQVAVCTVDNGVQIVGAENKILNNLQEFTYVVDDKTGNSKFPVGLRFNPRTNTLVLNGRTGSLQFYNTYTKNLLYNLNIVNQNVLSTESDRILYDIRVTKAAFNIDWLATGEVFNDNEHLPEMRLKFWKFQEESQCYALNTCIEMPHEGGFKAIEFSNDYQVDNLLCATVGEDNIIKMWSLEDSDNIYKEGKSWYCIAQASYRNLPVESISFSQDGSLLAAGFGNTLCIYKAEDLKLKAALTGASGLDGCVTKAQIRIPSKDVNGAKTDLKEKRDKLMKLFSNMLDMNEDTLVKELQKTVDSKNTTETEVKLKPVDKLDDNQKKTLYTRILQMHELNLFQKVMLYQKLGIGCKVHPQMVAKITNYINSTVQTNSKHLRSTSLRADVHRLSAKDRFKAKYRLDQHRRRQIKYDANITGNLVPLLSLLNLDKSTKQPQLNNGIQKDSEGTKLSLPKTLPPKPTTAEITQVQFSAGEYGHLVVVCTERRILIWNLLTLRLQSVLKLSVKHLTFDPQTNLIAVITTTDELHIFQPNVPLPIYQRRNLPQLYGMAWIPRRYPKHRSINLDWQAQSTLYFLTQEQKIILLSSPTEKQPDVPEPIVFNNAASESMRYSTFGTYAVKSVTEKHTSNRQSGPLVLGNSDKTAVKALIDMSTHTMPPMSLMCEDFLKSMVKPVAASVDTNSSNSNSHSDDKDVLATRLNGDAGTNGFGSHSGDDEDDDDDNNQRDADGDTKMTNGDSTPAASAINLRKDLMRTTEELKRKQKSNGIQLPANDDVESQLRFVAKQIITLEF